LGKRHIKNGWRNARWKSHREARRDSFSFAAANRPQAGDKALKLWSPDAENTHNQTTVTTQNFRSFVFVANSREAVVAINVK
jgi:hypothetical protein